MAVFVGVSVGAGVGVGAGVEGTPHACRRSKIDKIGIIKDCFIGLHCLSGIVVHPGQFMG
jgi:hypothetical protein